MSVHVDGEGPRIKVCGDPPEIIVTVTGVGPPGPPGPPGDSGASATAAAILLTPSLTPEPGDEIWTVTWVPDAGTNDFSGPVDGNPNFHKVTSYEYTGIWEADPNDVVLLMLDEGEGGQQDYWPSLYARFTGTGFEPITLPGGTLVSLSCGGAGFGVPTIFVGSNWDSPVFGGTWPLGDSEFFQPLSIAATQVVTRYNYTGNLSGTYNLNDALNEVDGLVEFDPLQPWLYSHTQAISFYAEAQTSVTKGDLTGWGFDTTPDGGAAGFLIGATGTTRRYTAMGAAIGEPLGRVAVSTVSGLDTWAEPREVVLVDDLPGTFDYASGGTIVDLGNGVGMMLLHVEQYDTGWAYWTMHAAKVVDDGSTVTITYLGEIISPEMDLATTQSMGFPNTGIGPSPTVVWNGDAYVYFGDYNNDGVSRATVARCSQADIAAAANANVAPSFVKWNGEALDDAWTEPGLGGTCKHSESISRSGVWLDADMMIVPDNRILAVGSDYGVGAVRAMRSSVANDPLTWSQRFPWNAYSGDPNGDRLYTTVWSGDPASPQSVTGRYIYVDVFQTDNDPSRWEGTYELQRFRLQPSGAPLKTPVQTAAAYYVQTNTDLTGVAEGFVIADFGATITLPNTTSESASWQIWNVGGDDVTVTASAPINQTGDVTITQNQVWTFWPLSELNLWVGYETTGSGGAGPAGASAYEVAVANGFVGDEAAWLASLVGPQGDPGPSATYYTQTPVTLQPWSQGDIDLDAPSGSVDAVVIATDNPFYVQATVNFTATADVITEATTGTAAFMVDRVFRSLDGSFSGWIWGIYGQDVTASVRGVYGGLPFVGAIHGDGSILDSDGNQVFRTIKNGDTLAGTITGIFNAD